MKKSAAIRPVSYSSDLVNRVPVLTSIALLGAVLAFGLFQVLDALTGVQRGIAYGVSLFVGPPIAFHLCFRLYNEVLWHTRLFGLPLSALPDLRGHWEGFVTIEGGAREEEIGANAADARRQAAAPAGTVTLPCHVTVVQTWATISLAFETEFTTSVLTMASINSGRAQDSGLRYEYLVTPKMNTELQLAGMGTHFGTAHLLWDDDDPAYESMEGEFYNGRGYVRYGRYSLRASTRRAAEWRASVGAGSTPR